MTRQKRILVAASMNAGAETVSPVAKRLKERGIKVRVLSYRAATSSFNAMGVKPDRIFEKKRLISGTDNEILEFNPTSVLTGTQVQDATHPFTFEQLIWNSAKLRGIRSVVVLDTWGNYAERFSNLDASSGPTKLTIKEGGRLRYLPSKIAIMDEFAKKEMVKEGFNPAILEITGSPYFEHVLEETAWLTPKTREQLLAKSIFSSFDKGGKLIVFMSDSIENFYPNIGFTEKSVLQSFLKTVDRVAQETGMKINVIVRPHPFRNENAKEAYECETQNINKVLHNPASAQGSEPENEYSMEELLYSADLIVGTFNNPLITAKIMGKTVIHYQPDVAEEYDFQYFLSEQGLTTKITEKEKLGKVILDALNGKLIQKTMEAAKGAIDKVIRLLE